MACSSATASPASERRPLPRRLGAGREPGDEVSSFALREVAEVDFRVGVLDATPLKDADVRTLVTERHEG